MNRSGLISGLALAALIACGDKVEIVEDTSERGAEGESCTSRDDCEDGLACVDNRCVEPGSDAEPEDGGVVMVMDTRGAAGESCTRRADCQAGNACVDNVCVDEESLPEGMLPSVRGERGESCQARNDCQGALACINERCTEHDFGVEVQAMECFRVQCETDEECCESFIPQVNCPSLEADCNAGDTFACDSYQALCVCQLGCRDQLCVVANQCTIDTDCGSTLLHCYDGQCAQCAVATDCTGEDQQCVAGICRAACQRNEQCPLFQACEEGQCVDVGCQSARECYFATMNPLSVCQDGACVTPCENDAECGDFQVCEAGSCLFAGCETDEECRVLLGLANLPGSDRAVCRAPEP